MSTAPDRRRRTRYPRPCTSVSILPDKPENVARDLELLREAMRDVAPIKDPGRVAPTPRQVDPIPVQRQRETRDILTESLSDESPLEYGIETGDALAYLRTGLSRHVLRKLRRGFWVIQGELDLHGMTVAAARTALVEFLSHSVREGLRCVRIIHGRGLRSPTGEPVLKRRVASWLIQRDEILAYCQARPEDGGAGAMLVLLRGTAPKAVKE